MNSQPLVPDSDQTASVWPRRATKACASCRRDKIRCDGARPCTGCTKKGYSADQCIDGCEPCRRARARCEGGKPCLRCREMQTDCVEDVPSVAPRQEVVSSTSRAVRGASDRAKLACTNCRRDNKKCDDQRPCSRCIARSEECIHVGRGPKLVKLRCEACREENRKCEETRPCRYCAENSRQCVSISRRGRGHGTRVKAACMNCRRDKIRCDGVRPCSACIRKHCECIERACKACSRAGTAADCTHRKAEDANFSDAGDVPIEGLVMMPHAATSHMGPEHGLPPMSHHQQQQYHGHLAPPIPHPEYASMVSPQHYYYPTQPTGQPMPTMQTQMYISDQRSSYYPVIDPNIDNHSGASHILHGNSNHR